MILLTKFKSCPELFTNYRYYSVSETSFQSSMQHRIIFVHWARAHLVHNHVHDGFGYEVPLGLEHNLHVGFDQVSDRLHLSFQLRIRGGGQGFVIAVALSKETCNFSHKQNSGLTTRLVRCIFVKPLFGLIVFQMFKKWQIYWTIHAMATYSRKKTVSI